MTKVKHHSIAHLVLIVALFLLSSLIFGGWTEGPLKAGLFIGSQVYALIAGAHTGDLASMQALSGNILTYIIVFLINLSIYYIVSSVLIFIFNLFFKSK